MVFRHNTLYLKSSRDVWFGCHVTGKHCFVVTQINQVDFSMLTDVLISNMEVQLEPTNKTSVTNGRSIGSRSLILKIIVTKLLLLVMKALL